MRTIDHSTAGHDNGSTGSVGTHQGTGQHVARPGRATRAGVPTIHLAHTSDREDSSGSRASVPAQASTGVAELLRGPVRPARVLLSVPSAVYLTVPTPQ